MPLLRQPLNQPHPLNLLIGIGIALRREVPGSIEAAGGQVHLVGPSIALVGDRSAASRAKGAPGFGVGAETPRLSLFDDEVHPVDDHPGDGLGADCPSAIAAVAVGPVAR